MRTGLNGHAARHLAHGCQQGQATVRRGDRLVGDAGSAGCQQRFRLLRVGGQVQIGEQQLAGAQHTALRSLRLLDLDDHLRLGEYRFGVSDDLRARIPVLGIVKAYRLAAIALHQYAVAIVHQLSHAGRRETNAILVILDFLGYANQHWYSLQQQVHELRMLVGNTGLFSCIFAFIAVVSPY